MGWRGAGSPGGFAEAGEGGGAGLRGLEPGGAGLGAGPGRGLHRVLTAPCRCPSLLGRGASLLPAALLPSPACPPPRLLSRPSAQPCGAAQPGAQQRLREMRPPP